MEQEGAVRQESAVAQEPATNGSESTAAEKNNSLPPRFLPRCRMSNECRLRTAHEYVQRLHAFLEEKNVLEDFCDTFHEETFDDTETFFEKYNFEPEDCGISASAQVQQVIEDGTISF